LPSPALASRTLVARDGVPQVIDGFELAGGGERFGGWPYMATVHVLAPDRLDALAGEAHALLEGPAGLWGSASAPAPGVLCARLLGATAPALGRCAQRPSPSGANRPGLPASRAPGGLSDGLAHTASSERTRSSSSVAIGPAKATSPLSSTT
jgi:hypothetical protein